MSTPAATLEATGTATGTAIGMARPVGADWRAIGCECRVVVTDPASLERARALLAEDLAALDLAASRFRDDSEISRLAAAGGVPTPISPLLATLLRAALDAAAQTGGAVDPTLGQALVDCGYDADLASLPRPGSDCRGYEDAAAIDVRITSTDATPAPPAQTAHVVVRPRARWTDVALAGTVLTTPPGMLLDLGATAKAVAADRAATRIADELGCGVLVSLGGDVAVAGEPPPGGWSIRVQDLPQPLDAVPDGPAQTVAIAGGGLATSSIRARRWAYGAAEMHHLLDPRTGLPAVTPWRTVTAAAPTCLAANIATTATIVLGADGLAHARSTGLPMRLVALDGTVTLLGGWPA